MSPGIEFTIKIIIFFICVFDIWFGIPSLQRHYIILDNLHFLTYQETLMVFLNYFQLYFNPCLGIIGNLKLPDDQRTILIEIASFWKLKISLILLRLKISSGAILKRLSAQSISPLLKSKLLLSKTFKSSISSVYDLNKYEKELNESLPDTSVPQFIGLSSHLFWHSSLNYRVLVMFHASKVEM